MRRIIHIIMSLTLILATTGLTISKHYCGNSIVRTTLGTKAESCMPGMDMDQGCCDETTETLVLDDDFQVSYADFKMVPVYDLLIAYLVSELAAIPEQADCFSLTSNDTGPPPVADPLYIKVQSFLL